jgi:HEAT repeat protein
MTKKPASKVAVHTAKETKLISIIQNKSAKAKEKTFELNRLLIERSVSIDELVETAKTQKDVIKAALIEALEYTSKTNPETINEKAFDFVIQSLNDEAPRVKWEAAKVIANTAHLFPKKLKKAITNLLPNTEHVGNVVRWSAAMALSEIISLNTPLNKELIPTVDTIILREEDNAVKKIYQRALKKSKK